MRFALGAMRLTAVSPAEEARDEAEARAVLRAALEAGVRTVDTARAYGRDAADVGRNERLVAEVVRAWRAEGRACEVVTKCGMRRDGGAWIPDGRAGTVRDDARASAATLGAPPDLLLLHAPDPQVELATSVRALLRAKEEGLARAVGLSNVSRRQLVEARAIAPIDAVEVALGAYDDLAIRGGVVAFCRDHGIRILAHAPLGGPERARRLAKDRVLAKVGARLGAPPIEVFLAWLLGLDARLEPVVGARRVATIAGLARATSLALDDAARSALAERFPVLASLAAPPAGRPAAARPDREVVLVMGIPGAGKSTAARALEAEGFERLNRDTLGGRLRGIAKRLEERLARDAGPARLVLDNTYVTRAVRSDVVRVAERHGAHVRCVHHDITTADAQVNVVRRMLGRFGRLLEPEAMRAAADPEALAPHALFRMVRELEPPEDDEGFTSIEVRPFVRAPRGGTRPGALVTLAAARDPRAAAARLASAVPGGAPVRVAGWLPGPEAGDVVQALAQVLGRPVEHAFCTHPAGPPVCWCRPPLPGLWLAFEHAHDLDPARSVLVGASAAERAMAAAIGLREA